MQKNPADRRIPPALLAAAATSSSSRSSPLPHQTVPSSSPQSASSIESKTQSTPNSASNKRKSSEIAENTQNDDNSPSFAYKKRSEAELTKRRKVQALSASSAAESVQMEKRHVNSLLEMNFFMHDYVKKEQKLRRNIERREREVRDQLARAAKLFEDENKRLKAVRTLTDLWMSEIVTPFCVIVRARNTVFSIGFYHI